MKRFAMIGFWLVFVCVGRLLGCALLPANFLTRALQSTFLQHAAGSLIWVSLIPLASEQWLALIPVVAIERLLAVCSIGWCDWVSATDSSSSTTIF